MKSYVNNPDYTPFQRKLVSLAFDRIHNCPDDNKAKIISFLTKGKTIVSWGFNDEFKTDPKASAYVDFKIHAEFMAVMRMRHYIESYAGMSIYNVRISRHNQVLNSKPCHRCLGELLLRDIRKIYYTNEFGLFQKLDL